MGICPVPYISVCDNVNANPIQTDVWSLLKVCATSLKLEIRLHTHQVSTNTCVHTRSLISGLTNGAATLKRTHTQVDTHAHPQTHPNIETGLGLPASTHNTLHFSITHGVETQSVPPPPPPRKMIHNNDNNDDDGDDDDDNNNIKIMIIIINN